jgi:hypothetical protein
MKPIMSSILLSFSPITSLEVEQKVDSRDSRQLTTDSRKYTANNRQQTAGS